MAIKHSVDELVINEYAGKTRLIINGWCADEDGSVPSLEVVVNGKNIQKDLFRVNRYDVLHHVKLPESAKMCGFMISVKGIGETVRTLQIIAEDSSETKTILNLDEKEVSEKRTCNPVVAKVDNVGYNVEGKTLTVSGWAIAEKNAKIDYFMKDKDGNVTPCIARSISRDDIVTLGYTDKANKYCGFMVTYPCEMNKKLTIVLKCDGKEIALPARVLVPHRGSALKSILTNINPTTIDKGFKYLKKFGIRQTIRRLRLGYAPRDNRYDEWFRAHRITAEELKQQKKHTFAYNPKISLLVPTFNTPLPLLKEMIETVQNQSYKNWELCIADGSNPDDLARQAIKEYAAKDKRIQVTYLDQNYGISGNTNKALEIATGDYTAMYDHDDFLELNALYEIVNVLNEKKYDIVYTDEDKFSMSSMHFEDPNLKPDFSIDLLRSHNYITHLFVVRTDILKGIGGFHKEYDGSQDYDVILRCIEKTDQIYHLPKILYHWRMHPGSTAADPESKMYCYTAGQKAIQDHLNRCGIDATVEMLGKPYYGLYHVHYKTAGDPLVSIVIPNYENKKVLERCINSLYRVNTYKNFEVIIIENNSTSDEIFEYYKAIQVAHDNIHVVTWEGKEFNYSAINNYGVRYAKGKYLLFLNNDTEVIAPTAIEEMLGCCMREEVGIVGAKLLYPDDTVQHAGVVIGLGGSAGHVFSRIPKNDPGYMMRPLINCNYSAVTAACLMTERAIFDEVGGFDEELKVAFNDIDFCLKVRQLNKLVVYNAFALWYHYESISRGYENSPEKVERFEREIKRFQNKWHQVLIDGDPFYNANFDVSYTPFELH